MRVPQFAGAQRPNEGGAGAVGARAGGMDTMSKISSLIPPPPKTADHVDSDGSDDDWS